MSNSNISISLCIPAYNSAEYLPRLLDSAAAQTVPFTEIWVYDDCSNDETGDIARRYGANVIRGDVNRGCSHGKNILAKYTTCEWIHFHDSDDALYPNFVEQAVQWMLSNNCPDVVLFDYESRDHETNQLLGTRHFDRIALTNDTVLFTLTEQINPFCGIYRRSSFLNAGGWDEDRLVLQSEDQATHGRLARHGLSFDADSNITVICYIRKNSMTTGNLSGAARSMFHVMRKALEELNHQNNKYSEAISQRLWNLSGVSAAYLDWQNADACVNLATKLTGNMPQKSSNIFRLLCSINPYWAIRIREYLIRFLKPSLRQTH
jgi:glycosyltransferase involved in cell wall biosynthesis